MRRGLATVLGLATACVLLAGCSPEHTTCSNEGALMVSSQYGTFHCTRVPGGNLQWEK